jgi:hypothetical protein
MKHYGGELNSGLIALCEALRSQPMVASKVRLSIVGFSGDVAVRLALADIRDTQELPELIIRGSTNYRAALQDLITRIPQDIAALKRTTTWCTCLPSSSSAKASPTATTGSVRTNRSSTGHGPRPRPTSSRSG